MESKSVIMQNKKKIARYLLEPLLEIRRITIAIRSLGAQGRAGGEIGGHWGISGGSVEGACQFVREQSPRQGQG